MAGRPDVEADVLDIARRRLAERRERGPQQAAPLRCLIAGCATPAVDIAYCAMHRRLADDGSLWLRGVLGDGDERLSETEGM